MIFRRYYTMQSKQNAESLKASLLGKHLKIHQTDFEIFDLNGVVKIIPHAESDEAVHTLPITELKLIPNASTTTIKMKSKPRRIDIGGIYLLMVFILFLIIASIIIYISLNESYHKVSYILFGSGAVIFILVWLRMEQGYFDYIRKTKKWVAEHI